MGLGIGVTGIRLYGTLAALLCLATPAMADSLRGVGEAVRAVATAVAPPPVDPASLDWSVLNIDPNTPAITAPDRSLLRSDRGPSDDLQLNHNEQANGAAAISFGKRLPTTWDTKVGVDVRTAAPETLVAEPGKQDPLAKPDQTQSGAAWASVSAPAAPLGLDKASIDARVDPQDRSKLGTTVSRRVPLGGDTALTLENSSSVAEALPGGVAPGSARAQIWDLGNSVKLSLPNGTTLAAGTSISSADNQRHNSLTAEQKLFGPLSLKSTVTDPGTTGSVKTIGAEFKRTW